MSQIEPYPDYSRAERIADGSMHFVGVSGAFVGVFYLVFWSVGRVDAGQSVALALYGATLIATFVASALYHMTPWENLRHRFRTIDHALIYLKIAGTYTPLVVMIGTLYAYAVLAVVWSLAIFGMAQKLFFWRTPGRFGPGLYLTMGWLSILLAWSIVPLMTPLALVLLAAGGVLYSVGVIFFSWETLKFSNAIWHGFVVVASACFFFAIALGVQTKVA